VNIFITSVGRRNYLLKWFRDAGSLVGSNVRIVAGDGDPLAPAFEQADDHVLLPPITSPEYLDAVLDACRTHEVKLLMSLHDYDIATISNGALAGLSESGVIAAIPPKPTITIVEDKLATARTLNQSGLLSPFTLTADAYLERSQDTDFPTGSSRIVKHRFGSGSSGVFLVADVHLEPAILMSSLSAPDRRGLASASPDNSFVIVQEAITGQEFGLDVVCDFSGRYVGVLARKKLRMRAGETDRAVSVDSAPFSDLAERLAASMQLCGSTDVDVIVTQDGKQYIIDINPRFGGGYPFVHLAGANVPACYLAWVLGTTIDPGWLRPRPGITSSKYEAVYGPSEQ
jgi:carbamoyl-phosphate synthase large subunit